MIRSDALRERAIKIWWRPNNVKTHSNQRLRPATAASAIALRNFSFVAAHETALPDPAEWHLSLMSGQSHRTGPFLCEEGTLPPVDTEEAWFSLRLDDRGKVVLLIGDDHVHLGPSESACAELRRFLAEVAVSSEKN